MELDTVDLTTNKGTITYMVYAKSQQPMGEMVLMMPLELYQQFYTAVAVDEAQFKKALLLFLKRGAVFTIIENDALKEEIYVAAQSGR